MKPVSSKVFRTVGRSESVRVTIPSSIASFLEVSGGDEVRWSVDSRTGRVIVEKVTARGPER